MNNNLLILEAGSREEELALFEAEELTSDYDNSLQIQNEEVVVIRGNIVVSP